MRPSYLTLLIIALIAGVSEINAQQRRKNWTTSEISILNEARALAVDITSDREFQEIVLAAADANEIAWPTGTLRNIPVAERGRPTRWVIDRLDEVGHFPISEILVGNLTWTRRKKIRAKTVACLLVNQLCTRFTTRFNPRIVRSDRLIALANTFIHERIHAIGQRHVSQDRTLNLCEAPSVIGDIAESLLARRELGRPITPRQRLCRAINDRLRALDIVR